MTPFSIAGVQMKVELTGENVSAMKHQVDVAMARFPWVNMLVFSELSPYGPLITNHPENSLEFLETFQKLAVRYKIWIIPGSVFERREGQVFNTSFVINPQGEIVGKYDKMFPFMPYEQGVTGGTNFLVFDVPEVGRFGLSICYDMWFPETTRTLTAMGAEVILHPVLTGTTDRDIELSIARATAAQFQCYIFDINGLSAGGVGRSNVVAPGGSIMHEARGNEEILPLEIDLDIVRHQRARGKNGLGQVLKSFRDRNVEFGVYDRQTFDHTYHHSLGKLEMPKQHGVQVEPYSDQPFLLK